MKQDVNAILKGLLDQGYSAEEVAEALDVARDTRKKEEENKEKIKEIREKYINALKEYYAALGCETISPDTFEKNADLIERGAALIRDTEKNKNTNLLENWAKIFDYLF